MIQKEDEILRQKVIDQLKWDQSVNATKIEVKANGKTIQLSGVVPNFTAKMAAERDAMLLKGVENIENYIRVEFPPAITIPNDDQITQQIKQQLKNDSQINEEKINLSSDDGVVSLTGTVYSYWEKNLVEGLIGSTQGVVGIDNKLTVNLSENVQDVSIEGDINQALERSILVDESNIEVKVKNGVALISGRVANNLIRDEAERLAAYTKGVTDVINEITIS